MGPEVAAAVSAITAAAGTAASMHASNEQRKDRRAIMNRQLEANDEATEKSAQKVAQEGRNFSMEAREQALAQQDQQGLEQAQADLQLGAGGANIATAADAGNVSADFIKSKAARAIEEGSRLTSVAREAAKARAPGRMQFDDKMRFASLAGDLQNLWGGRRNMQGAAGLDMQNVEEPMYGGLGRIATAIAPAIGGMGGSIYDGSSTNPSAPNYENSFDRMNPRPRTFGGIQWG